jgi:hypothetical protein
MHPIHAYYYPSSKLMPYHDNVSTFHEHLQRDRVINSDGRSDLLRDHHLRNRDTLPFSSRNTSQKLVSDYRILSMGDIEHLQ